MGVAVHDFSGTDTEKIKYLQEQVYTDFKSAKRYPIPEVFLDEELDGMLYDRWFSFARIGRQLYLFEESLQEFDVPASLIYCITPIRNGRPFFQKVEGLNFSNINLSVKEKNTDRIVFQDYLNTYLTEEGFDLVSLLDDDYFKAIKLLYNHNHFVSSLKLLVSFIDTIAFLEYGDIKQNIFIEWLNEYTALEKVEITPTELWELRNGILHMTNSESRKVIAGKVNRLNFYVSESQKVIPEEYTTGNVKNFNLKQLIDCIGVGIGKWCESYNRNPHKFAEFVMRYDKILSDTRHLYVPEG